jgi:molecular chaperone HscC
MVDLAAAPLERAHGITLHPNSVLRARLQMAAEQAKQALSTQPRVGLCLPSLDGQTPALEVELSRDQVEAAWAQLLLRVQKPIQRALADARFVAADIDEVLLVGGATRMPCFVALVRDLLRREPDQSLPADTAVALGAAVQAALKQGCAAVDDMIVTDLAPFTLGVETGQRAGSAQVGGLFLPIIERGTVVPVSRVKRLCTINDNQTNICCGVYQGEHAICKDNQKLGKLEIRGLPPRAAGKEQIDIRFTYDINGILEVEVESISTGKLDHLVIEQYPGRLSAAEIAAARRRLQELKIHPRTLLPNRVVLEQAQALFVELSGPPREDLGERIGTFLLALESQDSEIIDQARAQLKQMTRLFRPGPPRQ